MCRVLGFCGVQVPGLRVQKSERAGVTISAKDRRGPRPLTIYSRALFIVICTERGGSLIGSHEAEVLSEDALQFEGLRVTEGAGRAMGLQDVEGFRSVRGRPSLALSCTASSADDCIRALAV